MKERVAKKRTPLKVGPLTKKDIYVRTKSVPKAQLKRAKKMLTNGVANGKEAVLTIHGLGRAVEKAVELELMLQRDCASVGQEIGFIIETGTQTLLDDVVEECDEQDEEDLDKEAEVNQRLNSSIHIRVVKKG